MSLSVAASPVPLRLDSSGTYRVGPTRVTLHTVVGSFNEGHSAEQIVLQYPTLSLADVYAVISYYLQHKVEVDAHLAECDREADIDQRRSQANANLPELRAKLLARRNGQG
jgi:uncharacterized protein (DUF433 family)